MADHHFVPQFYLRGFRDPSSLGAMPKDQWLWVADRARGEVKALPTQCRRAHGLQRTARGPRA